MVLKKEECSLVFYHLYLTEKETAILTLFSYTKSNILNKLRKLSKICSDCKRVPLIENEYHLYLLQLKLFNHVCSINIYFLEDY